MARRGMPHDFREALVLGSGGEVDVAAGVTGAVLGALPQRGWARACWRRRA